MRGASRLALGVALGATAAGICVPRRALAQPRTDDGAPECSIEAGVHVVPDACTLGRALTFLDRALALEPAVCAASLGPTASRALAEVCPAAPAPRAATCDEATAATVSAWADGLREAATAAFLAWETHPLAELDLLSLEQAARTARRAYGAACPRATVRAAADETARARDAYLERARAVPSAEALCDAREDLVGEAFTGATSRWALAPVADALAAACGVTDSRRRRTFTRAVRAATVADHLVELLDEVAGPLVVASRPGGDPLLRETACGALGLHAGLEARDRVALVCPVADRASVAWRDRVPPLAGDEPRACGAQRRASERAYCTLREEVWRGPLSAAAWDAVAEGARGGVYAWTSARLPRWHAPRSSALDALARVLPEDLRLSGEARAHGSCARVTAASDAIVGRPPATLGLPEVRILVASARCRGTSSEVAARAREALDLSTVRDAVAQSPLLGRREEALALAGTAGLLLLSTPGYQAAGREMIAPLFSLSAPVEALARVGAGGAAPDRRARHAAAMLATRALFRSAEVSIDLHELADARRAIALSEEIAAGGGLGRRDRSVLAADARLLGATLELERGRPRAAADELAAAREALLGDRRDEAGARGDRRLLHELRARELEVGVVEDLPAELDGCGGDLARRAAVRRAADRDLAPGERRAVLALLRADAARLPLTRGPCLRARGFRAAEVRAALAQAVLIAACLDDGDRGCVAGATDGAREVGDALVASARALERAVDDLLAEGDADRTRSAAELGEEVRSVALEVSRDARLAAWRRRGAAAPALERLRWLAYSLPTCLAYPDVRVQLKWLAGREVPRCVPLERPPDDGADVFAYARYVRVDGRPAYVAWRASEGRLRREDLGPAPRIERLITDAVRELADATTAPEATLREAFDLLVAPLLAGAPPPSDLVVVPDATLAGLPFEPLFVAAGPGGRDPPSIRYALDVHPLGPETALPRGGAAVVLADPRFGPSDGAVGIARLRGTGVEAELVCRAFDCGARRLTRSAATEPALFAAVQQRLGRYAVVHLATHAIFGGRDGVSDRAAVLLAGVGDDVPEDALFATRDDGLLQESELATLGLPYTDLVVLSACGTARGESRAGVRGLARAARLSGARAVLGSLWSVDDAATAQLMRALYDRLGRGVPPPTALREAAAAVRSAHPHPYYWAPFVLLESP